jgi:glycosyltransferase involved in cell wall biosynthesis
MKRLRILAIAYACNPTSGSEPGVGWGWVNAIATAHNVTVITADYNSGDIKRYLRDSNNLALTPPRFVYVKNRPWHYRPQGIWLKIENSPAKPLMNLAYQDWLRCAFAVAKREVVQNRYDLVHLIGGIKNTRMRLFPILGFKGAFYYAARNLVNSFQLATLQGPRRAMRGAGKGVIAATSEIQVELWNHFKVKSHVICEVGRPNLAVDEPSRRGEKSPLRICWSGMHLPGKALHLLLHAAARFPKDIDYSIEILGDGSSNRAWKSLACQLKIDSHCHWHGWLPRDQSLAVMRNSHVFAITSLKDLTSTVAVEAISQGLPVVCLDHCGFADLVTDKCGIKVYPGSAGQIISDLADALLKLYRNETLRLVLARGAIQRGMDYSWSSKMSALESVYADVMHL